METIESEEWYRKARHQTIKTLPSFIEEVRKAFPAYDELPDDERMQEGYRNGMVAGVLIGVASYTVVSNRYGWSCNQAGVVRNCIYKSFGLSDGKEDNLNDL